MIEQALQENNANLEFTQWEIVNIQVNQNDWEWNDQKDVMRPSSRCRS